MCRIENILARGRIGAAVGMRIEQQKRRYEAMQQDAAKLLQVATGLKQYVDKAGKDVLSLEVMRKAGEMEKLARQIKINLRGE